MSCAGASHHDGRDCRGSRPSCTRSGPAALTSRRKGRGLPRLQNALGCGQRATPHRSISERTLVRTHPWYGMVGRSSRVPSPPAQGHPDHNLVPAPHSAWLARLTPRRALTDRRFWSGCSLAVRPPLMRRLPGPRRPRHSRHPSSAGSAWSPAGPARARRRSPERSWTASSPCTPDQLRVRAPAGGAGQPQGLPCAGLHRPLRGRHLILRASRNAIHALMGTGLGA